MRFSQIIIIASLFLFSSLCVAGESVETKNPLSPADEHASASAGEKWSSIAQDVLMNALSLTGIKYKYGGSTPETGFDCSGFVRYVFQQATNLTLPHGARALSHLGQSVAAENLQPGDLVFFKTLKSTFSHVGIYLGNNRFIHAPSAGGGIHIADMNDAYWVKRFNGARRLEPKELESTTPSTSAPQN